jgi:hypothetical protein
MGEPRRFQPMTLALGLLLAAAAAVYPLLPEPLRPWNFAAFGAIGLFVAARVGLLPGLLMILGSKLAFDLLNYRQHGSDSRYLPDPGLYACFVLYPLLGWLLLRRTEAAWKIGGTALLGSVAFFLTTNALYWLDPSSGYDRGPAGLLQSYVAAIPFYRGTLLGDLAFSGALFGLHAALSRAYFPAERVAAVTHPVPVLETVR